MSVDNNSDCSQFHLSIITSDLCSACVNFKTLYLKELTKCLDNAGVKYTYYGLKNKGEVSKLPNGLGKLVSWFPFFILTRTTEGSEPVHMVFNGVYNEKTGQFDYESRYRGSNYTHNISTWIFDKLETPCKLITKKDADGNIICLTTNSSLGRKKYKRNF